MAIPSANLNIAMENPPFIDVVPIGQGNFHVSVCLPEHTVRLEDLVGIPKAFQHAPF